MPLFLKPLRPHVLKAFVTQAVAGTSEFGLAVARGIQRWRVRYGIRPASAEVFRLRAMGEPSGAVAEILGISELTYKKHVRNFLERTGGDTIEGEVSRLLRDVVASTLVLAGGIEGSGSAALGTGFD